MTGYLLILPEILFIVGALWALFADFLPGGDRGAAWVGVGLAAAAAVSAALAGTGGHTPFGSLLVFDGATRFARVAIAVLTMVWLLWTAGRGAGRVREAVALALFAATGASLMTETRELITLLVAIELSTIPGYVLIGYRRTDIRGLEGALKYFLLSMLTSLVMLYGFSFLYGLAGTTHYDGLKVSAVSALGILGLLLALVGMFAKLSAAPFHYWTPDAYAGAEPWTVAFVSTVPKVAGGVAIVRLVSAISPSAATGGAVLLVIAAVSMLLGNLGALTQTDVRRLMAYSGVAHTGYLLLGVAALSMRGSIAAVFYAVAYAAPSMAIMLVSAEEGVRVDDFNGLAQRRPGVAWSVVLLLLSLIGIPPLAGFFGKFSLFTAALAGSGRSYAIVVVLAVAMSVVSAGYYLRIVRAMFFAEQAQATEPVGRSVAALLAMGICVLAVVGLGLAAGPIFSGLGVLGH